MINAIRKENADRAVMAEIDYAEHLWMEKELKTVANVTGDDIAEFLSVAAQIPLRPTVRTYPLEHRSMVSIRVSIDPVRCRFLRD